MYISISCASINVIQRTAVNHIVVSIRWHDFESVRLSTLFFNQNENKERKKEKLIQNCNLMNCVSDENETLVKAHKKLCV